MTGIRDSKVLYRDKSYLRVSGEAWAVIRRHMKDVFRFMCMPALIYSLLATCAFTAVVMFPIMGIWLTLALIVVLSLLLTAYYNGSTFALLSRYVETSGFKHRWHTVGTQKSVLAIAQRLFPLYLTYIIIVGLLVLPAAFVVPIDYLFIYLAALSVVLVVLSVPLHLVEVFVGSEGATYAKSFKQGFGLGFKYWGTTFLVMLLTSIMTVFPCAVAATPAFILINAFAESHNAAAMGDAVVMPSYAYAMLFITTLIAVFVIKLTHFYIQWNVITQTGAIMKKEDGKARSGL